MLLTEITPLILCFNEQENIGRTISCLAWADEIVVIDSGSTDATLEICSVHKNVRVVTRRFESHANQWNFGLKECGVNTPWVLALDADYVLTPDFVNEMSFLDPISALNGFLVHFQYAVNGTVLSGSLYPPVICLYRRESGAYYEQDGHTQRLVLPGQIGYLSSRLIHDDRKSLERWVVSQVGYANLERDSLCERKWSTLRIQDKVRRLIVVAPWLVPLYYLVLKGGWRDGRAGLLYALQRAVAESILSVRLLESEMSRKQKVL